MVAGRWSCRLQCAVASGRPCLFTSDRQRTETDPHVQACISAQGLAWKAREGNETTLAMTAGRGTRQGHGCLRDYGVGALCPRNRGRGACPWSKWSTWKPGTWKWFDVTSLVGLLG